jgi:hypothetical protein
MANSSRLRREQIKIFKDVDRRISQLLKDLRTGVYIPEEADKGYQDWLDKITADFSRHYEEALAVAFGAVLALQHRKYTPPAAYLDAVLKHGMKGEAASLGMGHSFVDTLMAHRLPSGMKLSGRIWDLGRYGKDIGAIVRNGILNNIPTYQIARQLDGFILAGKHALGPTPYGRTLNFDSLRLARTETQFAHWKSEKELAQRTPWVTGLEWLLSPAHAILCVCDDYAGQIFEPAYLPMPPHPLCMCTWREVRMPIGKWIGALYIYFETGEDDLGIAEWLFEGKGQMPIEEVG